MNNRAHNVGQDCSCVSCTTLNTAYLQQRIVFSTNSPPMLVNGVLSIPIPSIIPYLRPVTYHGQPVRAVLPGNSTPLSIAPFRFNSPPAVEQLVICPPDRPFRRPSFQDTQPVLQHAAQVPAGRPAKATSDEVDHSTLNVQFIDIRHNHPTSRTIVPVSRKLTPTFILRYEGTLSVLEYQVENLTIRDDAHAVWDALLYRALTPSAYELVKDDFVLKLWRRPHWVYKRVCWKLGESAVANLTGIVDRLVAGDVLWIYPARGGPGKRRCAD